MRSVNRPKHGWSQEVPDDAGNKQGQAQNDGRIGHVENAGAKTAPANGDKVHHIAPECYSVEQVAETAAAKDREGQDRQGPQAGTEQENQNNDAQKEGGCRGDDFPAPPFRQISFEAENGTLILSVIEPDDVPRKGQLPVPGQMVRGNPFGDLIASDTQQDGEQGQYDSLALHHASASKKGPHFTFDTNGHEPRAHNEP
jgi:hypothetical protein